LADGPDTQIAAVVRAGVCQRLVDILSTHTSPPVLTPALRTIGNIVTGDDQQTQVILQCGALPALVKLLSNPKKLLRKEACWTISNVCAGNADQIQEVIQADLIRPLVSLMDKDDFDVRKEAAWAVSNAISGGRPEHIEHLVECGCIVSMLNLLDIQDMKMVIIALKALENILESGKKKQTQDNLNTNPYALHIERVRGQQKIEALLEEVNPDVYQNAMKILDFLEDDDDDDVDMILA